MGGGNGQKSATARARKQEADARRNGAGKARWRCLRPTAYAYTIRLIHQWYLQAVN